MPDHLFASLAHIRVLLIPVGTVQSTEFEKWAKIIRSFHRVALTDIPPDSREDKARFMPPPLATGHLHLSYVAFPPPRSHDGLSLICLSDFPLGVIGIASASSSSQMSTLVAEFNAAISELLPADSHFPLAAKCIAFEQDSGAPVLDIDHGYSGLVIIPSVMGNKEVYLSTIIAELCSGILGGFADITRVLETEQSLEQINGTMFPTSASLRAAIPGRGSSETLENTRNLMISQPTQESQIFVSRASTPLTLDTRKSSSATPTPGKRQSLASPGPATVKGRASGVELLGNTGRLHKILGDVSLLAGRLNDAIVWYTKAIALFKVNFDNIWHASALEGTCVAVILESYTANCIAPQPATSTIAIDKDSYSDAWSKMTLAIYYYGRLGQSGTATDFSCASFLYVGSILRQADLAVAVWTAQGWNRVALQTLATGYQTSTHNKISDVHRVAMSEGSGLSCSQIATILAQAHGPFLMHLHIVDFMATLARQASTYGLIGYHRKEAFLLRELTAVIMELIAHGRQETVNNGARSGPDIDAITSSEYTPALLEGSAYLGRREFESSEGNDSVAALVKYFAEGYGVNLALLALIELEDGSRQPPNSVQHADFSHGWPELQIGVVREAVAIAEALPDQCLVAQFALSALQSLKHILSAEDQQHLYDISLRGFHICRRRGDSRGVSFWLGDPVIAMTITPPPVMMLPFAHSHRLLDSGASDGPFIYDPRSNSSGSEMLIVQGELVEVKVELRNPFYFSCDIPSLDLSTSGVPFHSLPVSISIPPLSRTVTRLKGIPLEPGTLNIHGCKVQIPGSYPRIVSPKGESSNGRPFSAEGAKTKYSGLASRPWEVERRLRSFIIDGSDEPVSPNSEPLKCRVVDAQPLMRVKRTSLAHGSLMLYSGETCSVRLTLENISSIDVNFMRLSFKDSLEETLQELLLSDGAMTALEAFDCQNELTERPVFHVDQGKANQAIAAGDRGTLEVTCMGKLGCTRGSIIISYAYLSEASRSGDDTFYTRQLELPLLVTVYRSLVVQDMRIIPYPMDFDPEERHLNISDLEKPSAWCILSLEVRNFYGSPFHVTLKRVQSGTTEQSMDAVISPGATSRVAVPVKRVHLTDSQERTPIPANPGKQFVRRNNTADQDREERAFFWYREALLAAVDCRWNEVDGSRSGTVDLRQFMISPAILKSLRADCVGVSMDLTSKPSSSSSLLRRSPRVRWTLNCLGYLGVRVTNLTLSICHLRLALSVEPAEYAVVEVSSDGCLVQPLNPMAIHEESILVSFVAKGSFRICAEISQEGAEQLLVSSVLMVDVAD